LTVWMLAPGAAPSVVFRDVTDMTGLLEAKSRALAAAR